MSFSTNKTPWNTDLFCIYQKEFRNQRVTNNAMNH